MLFAVLNSRAVNPPNVAAVNAPKLSAPPPLVSSVLFCNANGLPSVRVPPAISVLPPYVFDVPKVRVPLSTLVKPPGPEREPDNVKE